MPRIPHAFHIDLRFGNSARDLPDFPASIRSGNLARKCLKFLRQSGIGKNGQA